MRWWGYAEIVPTGKRVRMTKRSSMVLCGPRPAVAAASRRLANARRATSRSGGEGALDRRLVSASCATGSNGLDDAFRRRRPFLPIGHYGMFAPSWSRGAPLTAPIPLVCVTHCSRDCCSSAAREVEDDLKAIDGDRGQRRIARDRARTGASYANLPDATGISFARLIAVVARRFCAVSEIADRRKRSRGRQFARFCAHRAQGNGRLGYIW